MCVTVFAEVLIVYAFDKSFVSTVVLAVFEYVSNNWVLMCFTFQNLPACGELVRLLIAQNVLDFLAGEINLRHRLQQGVPQLRRRVWVDWPQYFNHFRRNFPHFLGEHCVQPSIFRDINAAPVVLHVHQHRIE